MGTTVEKVAETLFDEYYKGWELAFERSSEDCQTRFLSLAKLVLEGLSAPDECEPVGEMWHQPNTIDRNQSGMEEIEKFEDSLMDLIREARQNGCSDNEVASVLECQAMELK